MRGIQVDLAQPFEEIVARVLSLPTGCSNPGGNRLVSDAEIKQVIRSLHEAANGRAVEGKSGRRASAPPMAAFLKKKPFRIATQVDFLIVAATRIICGPPCSDIGMRTANNFDETPVPHRRNSSASSRQAAGPHAERVSASIQVTGYSSPSDDRS